MSEASYRRKWKEWDEKAKTNGPHVVYRYGGKVWWDRVSSVSIIYPNGYKHINLEIQEGL